MIGMIFMNNFNNIFRFTTKRYGIDDLEKLLVIILIIIFFVSIFVKNLIIDLCWICLLMIVIARFLSKKNIFT